MAERCLESREAAPSICVLYGSAAAALSHLYAPRGISRRDDFRLCLGSGSTAAAEVSMIDALFLFVGVASFLLTLLYALACEHL